MANNSVTGDFPSVSNNVKWHYAVIYDENTGNHVAKVDLDDDSGKYEMTADSVPTELNELEKAELEALEAKVKALEDRLEGLLASAKLIREVPSGD